MWLDGYEHAPIDGKTGGTYTGDHPWRMVLHSTEGGTIEGAVSAYKTAGVPPHFTIDLGRRRKVQHVDLDCSAYAVKNEPGGVETNRWRAVQTEIVLYATDAANVNVDDLAFLAEHIGDVIAAGVPIKLHAPPFVAYPASYGQGAAQRMTFDAWATFDGICGHQHVPENDHGDPGALNIGAVFAHLVTQPLPASKDDDMQPAKQFRLTDDGTVIIVPLDGAKPWPVPGAAGPVGLQVLIDAKAVEPAAWPVDDPKQRAALRALAA